MNQDPMMVMQGTYIIKGKLSMYTSFAISLANSSGVLKGGIRYKLEGSEDSLKVTAFSNLKANDAEISYTISMKEAIAEGWTSNAKYKTLPELMLRYRAATLLIRTHIPEVLNGMHTVEELRDVELGKNPIKLKDVSNKDKSAGSLDSYLDEDEEKTASIEVKVSENGLRRFREKVSKLDDLLELYQVSEETVDKWLKKAQVDTIEDLPEEKLDACIDLINKKVESENNITGSII